MSLDILRITINLTKSNGEPYSIITTTCSRKQDTAPETVSNR